MLYWPLVICLVTTFYLVGLIWVIQVVHYPLFARVGPNEFEVFHTEHSQRILIALSIPTLLTFISSCTLLWIRPISVPDWSAWFNLALSGSFWVVTALVQVPKHGLLGKGHSAEVIAALVTSNWSRTLIWTSQGLLLLWMLLVALPV